MISARNRLQPLNGSRWPILLFIAMLAAACSPKVQPVAVRPKPAPPANNPVVKNQTEKQPQPVKPAVAQVSTISLLLPFGLDHLAPGASYTPVSLKEADIATAYYQGFKLALDSLALSGYNFKLQVYDTRGDKAGSHALAYNPAVRTSDLIVGPVFPDDLKTFLGAGSTLKPMVVSPLSPAAPSEFKKPELITVIPPLEYHAWAAAKFIKDHYDPQKVFVLRSGFSEENDYLVPFKRAIDSLGKKHIQIITITVIHGQINSLTPQLSFSNKNVFVVPATDQHFLTVTLHSLDSLSHNYPVAVFGHPNWVGYSFLKADLLQRLDTHITSADHIDWQSPAIVAFVKLYRAIYHTEATGFAIKGFDEGLYLGRLLGTGQLKNLAENDFTGLHNDFKFEKKAGLGWVNTHVSVYKYANFDLKKAE